MGYVDALKILAQGDSKLLLSIDRLLGGLLPKAATAAGERLDVLSLIEMRADLLRLSRQLLSGFSERVRLKRGQSRADLLFAAHVVIVITSYLLALDYSIFAVDASWTEFLDLNQDIVLDDPEGLLSREPTMGLIDAVPPPPRPYRPYKRTVVDMEDWYLAISQQLAGLVKLHAAWEKQAKQQQSRFLDKLLNEVPEQATLKYDDSFRQLATQVTEFRLWMSLTDSEVGTVQIAKVSDNTGRGLVDLQGILESLAVPYPPSELSSMLGRFYRSNLELPIVQTWLSYADVDLTIPSLAEAFINPMLHVAEYDSDSRLAEEDWWNQRAIRCSDPQQFLAGYLTSPAAADVPLVILGQPGSGKSLLTKILPARLPPSEYLSIRVELGYVAPDATLLDQIEAALIRMTGMRIAWSDFVQAAGDVLLIVILDGLDAMLQVTGISHSDYLEKVCDFQRREADLGRRIAVIATSRIVAAERFRFPVGTIAVKLEPFNDDQIMKWLQVWNDANVGYLISRGLRPFSREAALRYRDLGQQPLLLLMLALYDAGGNEPQDNTEELARAELYEGLLSEYVNREVRKYKSGLSKSAHARLVAAELQQLSIIAFALFNRGKYAVTEGEIDSDLTAFGLRGNVPERAFSEFSHHVRPAQLVVGRFFFIHQSRSLYDDTWQDSYEFLNGTFGEYLVARLTFHTLDRIVKLAAYDRNLAPRLGSDLADDELWALLSFAPLTDRQQIVSFLAEFFQRLDVVQRTEHREILSNLFRNALQPRQNDYSGYAPIFLGAPARHAAYSANLTILNVLAAAHPLSSKTFLTAGDFTMAEWQRLALLWNSQLSPPGWEGLATSHLFAKPSELSLDEIVEVFKETLTTKASYENYNPSIASDSTKQSRGRDAASDLPILSAFVSYSRKDERYRQALDISLAQLKRNALISLWHDRKILPGQQWDEEIDKNLETADIVLVLVSPDFLASDYAYTREMRRAIERHHNGLATVVPIILRPSDWQDSPLGDLQALPSNGRPISIWPKRDQAWLDVVYGLRQLISNRG